MGPQILYDKSFIQSLSYDEGLRLSMYYYTVITPILIVEILSDLQKYSDEEKCNKEVGKIASKCLRIDSVVNDNCLLIMKAELFGNKIEMSGRPIISRGKVVRGRDGKLVHYLEEQPEETIMRNWSIGTFDDDHRELARQWRNITNSVDLVSLHRHLKHAKHIPSISSLGELKEAAKESLSNKDMQLYYLAHMMRKIGLGRREMSAISDSFSRKNTTIDKAYPYIAHCLFVDISFCIALKNQLIGTRNTNYCDANYLYYIPFCKVFSSCDNTQFKIAKTLFSDSCSIVHGAELKADLKNINDFIFSCDEGQGRDWRAECGGFPPGDFDSITVKLWEKYMGKREDFANQPKLSPEAEAKLLKKIQAEFDCIKKLSDS